MEDEAIQASLAAIRSALTEHGRFVFETRNPLIRAWESWMPDDVLELVDPAGAVVRKWHEIETVDRDVVCYTTTLTNPSWDRPQLTDTSPEIITIARRG